MTVSFALLESQLQDMLGSLIREHQRVGQILSSYLSFANLRAAIASLYLDRHGEDDDFPPLKELLVRAGAVEEERNRITHSLWAAGNTPESITRLKITAREKHGFRVQGEQYDAAKLEDFTKSIKVLAGDFMRLHFELLDKGKIMNNPGAKLW